MSTINIVFQEKGKSNKIIKGKTNMTFSELIQSYFKNICASKKERMTKIFVFKDNEHSSEESSTLNELGLHDYSVIEVHSSEQPLTGHIEPPKKEKPPQEELEEEPQEVLEKELQEVPLEKLKNNPMFAPLLSYEHLQGMNANLNSYRICSQCFILGVL